MSALDMMPSQNYACLKSMALRQAVLPSSTLLTTGPLRTYVTSMVLPCSAIHQGAICSCAALHVMHQKCPGLQKQKLI